MDIETILKLVSGLFWTIVYLSLIWGGFKFKTYGMPFWALGLNIAWEFIYGPYELIVSDFDISLQRIVNLVWFFLDLVIVYTYFAYGSRFFPKEFGKGAFLSWSLLVLAASFVIQFLFLGQFPEQGAAYSAFLQNLLMSVLFILLLVQRANTEGQSLVTAISKFIGTLAPTILFGYIRDNDFILGLGILIAVFDILYIVLLARKRQAAVAPEA